MALQEQCPKPPDKLSFSARGNKLDWQKVDVGERTAEECKAALANMLAKVSTIMPAQAPWLPSKPHTLFDDYSNMKESGIHLIK